MTTNYTWHILNLVRRTSDGMVWNIEYKVSATKGELSTSTERYVKVPPAASPLPFSSLTEAQVITWVKERLGSEKEQKIIDFLDTEISKKENKTRITELPW